MSRCDLHISTIYSYKGNKSVIKPQDLLVKCQKENIPSIGIVDYCNCASIPDFEYLKNQMALTNLKIIYGITLIIKFPHSNIKSIILAKNNQGIKALYQIVTKLNFNKTDTILFKDLKKYINNLILGIDTITDYEENYLKYYTYLEINPLMSKSTILNLSSIANKYNLLLIATSKPNTLNKEDLPLLFTLNKNSNNNYYYSLDQMQNYFKFLPNYEEAIFTNPKQIIDMVTNYDFNFNNKYYLPEPEINLLKKEVLSRAKLIYLDVIPKSVLKRINYELSLIYQNNLAGTILFLSDIMAQARNIGAYNLIGSYFSHFVISYLLGLIEVNPLDYKNLKPLLNDYNNYGFYFEIFMPEKVEAQIKNYTSKYLNKLYAKGIYREINPEDYNFKEAMKLSNIKLNILPSFDTFYLVPKNIDILNITPLNYQVKEGKKLPILEFSHYLKKNFVRLRFRPTRLIDLLYDLSKKTKKDIYEIPLEDQEVLKNMYEVLKSNKRQDYHSYSEYFIANNLTYILKIEEPTPKITSLKDLINLNYDENWLSKVLQHYYISYYRTYYPEIYYELYLKALIKEYDIFQVFTIPYLQELEISFQNKIITLKEDAIINLIITTLFNLYTTNKIIYHKIINKLFLKGNNYELI